jgi:hypothetical protein
MPTSQAVLEGLTKISQQAMAVAIAWHIAIGAFLLALAGGWRPSRRTVGVGAAAPLLCVSAMAWIFGNPFNGIIFLAAAAAVGILGALQESSPIRFSRFWARIAGMVLLAFAWIYPHFLGDGPPLRYLVAAPLGLVPCPTLSLLLGLSLLLDGLSSKPGSLILAGIGLFYGLLGWVWLGVAIDSVLLLGSALVLLKLFLPARLPPSTPSPTPQ